MRAQVSGHCTCVGAHVMGLHLPRSATRIKLSLALPRYARRRAPAPRLITSGLPRIARSAAPNQGPWIAAALARSSMQCKAHVAIMNRFTHFLFTSGFPRMACSVAPKSVHLNCGKVNVDRRGAARSSMQLKARMLQIALDPSTHPLPTSGLSQLDPRCSSSFSSRLRHSLSWNAKARRYLASREKAELFAATT